MSNLVDQLNHGRSKNLQIEAQIISQVVQWSLADTLLNEKLVHREVWPQEVGPKDFDLQMLCATVICWQVFEGKYLAVKLFDHHWWLQCWSPWYTEPLWTRGHSVFKLSLGWGDHSNAQLLPLHRNQTVCITTKCNVLQLRLACCSSKPIWKGEVIVAIGDVGELILVLSSILI